MVKGSPGNVMLASFLIHWEPIIMRKLLWAVIIIISDSKAK